ncbi:MAG: type II toxin-antitoxin system RelE/ParE family toxin [Steroidobacteraceae bacterium]
MHLWPKSVRKDLGSELTRVQGGANPRHGAALPDIGRGVQEIRLSGKGEAYRVVYVANIGERVYVLHAFHKKSTHGIATPRADKELAKRRYKELCVELAARPSASGRMQ